jgi:hypothetical protein
MYIYYNKTFRKGLIIIDSIVIFADLFSKLAPLIFVLVLLNVSFRFLKFAADDNSSSSDNASKSKKKKTSTDLMIDNFIKLLALIRDKTPHKGKEPGIYSAKRFDNGKISFSLQSTPEPTILDYPSLEVFTNKQVFREIVRNPNRRNQFHTHSRHRYEDNLKDVTTYVLSFEDFNRLCKSPLNITFTIRMNNLIQLCEKEELQPKLHYLIPKFEISFNTILNVINEQSKNNGVEQFPDSMVEKMFYIIESFEKELFEAEEKRMALELLTAKAVEKNLEEQLDFEVKYIDKVKA